VNLIKKIQLDLATEIHEMEKQIASSLCVDENLIQLVCEHILGSGGKRIRPLLTILVSRMFEYSGNIDIKLATAIEFIHTATLLHDDVVDESKVRRNKPTANTIWGNKASILVGDFLFTQAFKLIVQSNSILAMNSISSAAGIVSQGEVSQLSKLNEKRIISISEYIKIIDSKTAALFGASCEVGAIITNQSFEICKNIKDFGINLGIIFQIVDDMLDYLGSSEQIGKNIGDDFFEGKVTLPLIMLDERLKSDEISQLIRKPSRNLEDFEYIRTLMIKYNIQNTINEFLIGWLERAKSLLNSIKINNRYKDYLTQLIEFTLIRSK
jgi:octaprenyl-diphosphate synthase